MPKIFALYDTETTGLTMHPKAKLDDQPRIIEFGGILTDGVNIIDELTFICNPGQAIDEKITEITGLTNADLDDKLPFSHYIKHLAGYFGAADIAMAHNASFDRALVKYDLERLDMTLEDINYPARLVCTVEETNPFYGYDRKLDALYRERIGEYVQTHRALSDVKQLHEVCKDMGIYKALGGL